MTAEERADTLARTEALVVAKVEAGEWADGPRPLAEFLIATYEAGYEAGRQDVTDGVV